MSNSFVTPWTLAYQTSLPWDFSGKNAGVGCHFFPQTQRLFYNKVLNIWHVLLNTVLTVRNRMLVWVECLRYPGCLPLWVCGWWGASACCHCPAPQESFVPHIASIRRSKFKVWFLLSVNHFHKIVKSKNHSVEPSYVRYCMYIPRPAPGSYFHSPTC